MIQKSSRWSIGWAEPTTTTFDNRGWVAEFTDSLGHTATYSYTATGKQATLTNPTSSGGASVVSFVYDQDDRLIAETDANANTTTITLDGVGNRTAVTDANSQTTSYAYDSMNRLTTITTPIAGDTTVFAYDSGGNQISVEGRPWAFHDDPVRRSSIGRQRSPPPSPGARR